MLVHGNKKERLRFKSILKYLRMYFSSLRNCHRLKESNRLNVMWNPGQDHGIEHLVKAKEI